MTETHWTERFFLDQPELFLPSLEANFDTGEEQTEQILSLLENRYDFRPESVLDVGCGIGRHVTAFAERGIESHGIDVADRFIERARERAAARGVADRTSFHARDMRSVTELSDHYDVVMNVYSFGFFEDATNEELLASFHERVNPGGVLLLKTFDKDGRLANFTDSGTHSTGDVTYVREREYDPLTSRRRSDGFVISDETFLGQYEFEVRLYSPVELARLVSEAGFRDIHHVETYDGEPLERESDTQIILGRASGRSSSDRLDR